MKNRQAYALDDPFVVSLGRFLQSAPMSDGRTTTGLGEPTTSLLAQAIVNWMQGLVWQDGRWVAVEKWETTPDLGDVAIEQIGDGAVVKITQRSTGLSALGESHEEAWTELKRKAADRG